MIAFAFSVLDPEALSRATQAGVKDVIPCPDPMSALAQAAVHREERPTQAYAVIGNEADIRKVRLGTDDTTPEAVFEEAYARLASQEGILYMRDGHWEPTIIDRSVQSLVHCYLEVQKNMARLLQTERRRIMAQQRQRFTGRPPFGYKVVDRTLVLDNIRAQAVRVVYSMAETHSVIDIVGHLRHKYETCSRRPTKKYAPYWTSQKVYRILEKRDLYAQGKIRIEGKTVTLPSHLIILKEQPHDRLSQGSRPGPQQHDVPEPGPGAAAGQELHHRLAGEAGVQP